MNKGGDKSCGCGLVGGAGGPFTENQKSEKMRKKRRKKKRRKGEENGKKKSN